ncbi:MAG TPA: hypothetical protein DD400_01795 [Rhodospirillaceae bacterium]|nr:hypothetical protein [Rhodospirillaceae bacterium]
MQKFGVIKPAEENMIRESFAHPDLFYTAMMDREALWTPQTIEKILENFPKGYIEEGDLFLLLAECIANSVLHGQAEALGFHARERHDVVLFSFFQIPPMKPSIKTVLTIAREGRLRECSEDLSSGLGFPILMHLVHRITTNNNLTKLQLWLRR